MSSASYCRSLRWPRLPDYSSPSPTIHLLSTLFHIPITTIKWPRPVLGHSTRSCLRRLPIRRTPGRRRPPAAATELPSGHPRTTSLRLVSPKIFFGACGIVFNSFCSVFSLELAKLARVAPGKPESAELLWVLSSERLSIYAWSAE